MFGLEPSISCGCRVGCHVTPVRAPSTVKCSIDDERTKKGVASVTPELVNREVPAEQVPVLTEGAFGALTHLQLRGTVYLLLDTSASMSDKGKMEGLVRGSLQLFTEARKRDYAVGIVSFADRAKLLLRASCDAARFRSQLQTLEPAGRTAMAQAIRLATRQLKRRRGDKTILLVTDGMPNNREATLNAARLARAQGITLIAVGVGHVDEAFLAALTPKPELAMKVAPKQLEQTLGDAAKGLPYRH